jgi:hypothetical protein
MLSSVSRLFFKLGQQQQRHLKVSTNCKNQFMSSSTTTAATTKLKFQQIVPTPTKGGCSPLPRSSHGLSIIKNGSYLVLYGGEHVARTPIHDDDQSLWIAAKQQHNTTTTNDEQWQWIVPTITSSDRPSPRVAHAQASINDNTIYIFGGRNGIEMGENAMNDMWMLKIVDASGDNGEVKVKWTQIHPSQQQQDDDNNSNVIPEARSFHKMIAVDTNIYMFGGCGSKGRLNDLWKFDTTTNMWRCLGASHLLKGRGGPNILSLSNGTKIGIVAGFAGEETNDGHVYDINKLAWEEKGMEGGGFSNMRPRSVCCFATLSKNNTCIIFGGEVDPSQKGHEGAGGFENDVVVLDGSDGSVLEIIKKPDDDKDVEWPGPRGWSDATTHEDTFYMFGGLAGDDTSPVRLGDLWQCKVTR